MKRPVLTKEGLEFRANAGTLAAPSPTLVDALGGRPAYGGERVTEEKAMGLTGVFAAVYKLSEVVGGLPLKVYRTRDDDRREEARTHRSYRMLHDKPNPHTTAHTFWSTVTAQLALGGNSYLLKERDDFDIVESLWILDPSKVRLDAKAVARGERIYLYTVTNGTTTREIKLTEADVTHVVGFSLDGITGCSRITYCRETFGAAIARDRYEGSFYRQGARVPGLIEYPGRLGPDGTKNLADSFAQKHSGADQMHKVPVLEEGATFRQMGMSLADMQFVENAQLSLTEIAVLFDLPPTELGGMHGGSLEYATEELNQIRLARACVPYTSRIASALSTDPDILPQNIMYAEFVLEALMRPDAKTRIEYWAGLKNMGVVDEAYIAARENLPDPPPKPKTPLTPPPPGNGNGNPAVLPSDITSMMSGRNGPN